jgi:glycerol-3-phosphate dehydrogenase
MAKMAVDRIVEREGRDAPCRTDEIPLGMVATPEDLPDVEGIGDDTRKMLVGRYGHAAHDVLALAATAAPLAQRISPDLPDIVAEGVFAARREQARSLTDVLMRRTRLGLLDGKALTALDADGPRVVAQTMAEELGWDDARVEDELDTWRRVAAAEGLDPSAPAVELGADPEPA